MLEMDVTIIWSFPNLGSGKYIWLPTVVLLQYNLMKFLSDPSVMMVNFISVHFLRLFLRAEHSSQNLIVPQSYSVRPYQLRRRLETYPSTIFHMKFQYALYSLQHEEDSKYLLQQSPPTKNCQNIWESSPFLFPFFRFLYLRVVQSTSPRMVTLVLSDVIWVKAGACKAFRPPRYILERYKR